MIGWKSGPGDRRTVAAAVAASRALDATMKSLMFRLCAAPAHFDGRHVDHDLALELGVGEAEAARALEGLIDLDVIRVGPHPERGAPACIVTIVMPAAGIDAL